MAGYVLATQYWLFGSTGPLLAVLAMGLGALWLPWGWAAHRLLSDQVTSRRMLSAVVILPSAWVAAEAVRSWERLGGPWALLGASQWNQPSTLASASLGGVWLTSFLVVAVNTAVVGVILLRSGRVVAAGGCRRAGGGRSRVVLVRTRSRGRLDGPDRPRAAGRHRGCDRAAGCRRVTHRDANRPPRRSGRVG